MPPTNEKTTDSRVEKVKSALRISYTYAQPYMKEAKRLLKNYLNQIDTDTWPTLSEARLPMEYSQVESLLATISDYFFNSQKRFFRFIPEVETSAPEVEKLENYLQFKLFSQMHIKERLLPILKSALILPCGYAMIERVEITPPTAKVLSASTPEGRMVQESLVEMGTPVNIPNLRHLDFFSVFPSPYGSTPENASYVCIVDFVPDSTIQAGIEQGILKGDIKEIKKQSKVLTSYADSAMVYAKYASDPENETLRPIEQNKEDLSDELPQIIPVIKYYGKDEIIWLVEDMVIYHHKKGTELLGNPLIKFSAIPVGDMWFTPSPLAYTSDVNDLINIFYNSVIDLLMHHLYPTKVINRQLMITQAQDIDRQPGGIIEGSGDPKRIIDFLQQPQLPVGFLEFPREIRSLLDTVSGLPEALKGQGGAGIVRGGSNALQSLLQVAGARTTLLAESLQDSGLVTLIEKVWHLLQTFPEEEEMISFVGEDEHLVYEQVTQDEIRHVMRIEMLTGKRMMNKIADAQIRQQLLPLLIQMGINPSKAIKWAMPDEDVGQLIGEEGLQPPAPVEEGGAPPEQGDRIQQQQVGGGGGAF